MISTDGINFEKFFKIVPFLTVLLSSILSLDPYLAYG